MQMISLAKISNKKPIAYWVIDTYWSIGSIGLLELYLAIGLLVLYQPTGPILVYWFSISQLELYWPIGSVFACWHCISFVFAHFSAPLELVLRKCFMGVLSSCRRPTLWQRPCNDNHSG